MDLSKVSLEDLQAYKSGDLKKVSLEGLQAISATEQAAPPADPRGAKIDTYLAETDQILGLPQGTSARQINQESRFDSQAYNAGSKAAGLAQMLPRTTRVLSVRASRPLDPYNEDDALYMHREVMRENLQKFGNPQDSIRAYNSGWNPSKWNNTETNNYVDVIFPKGNVGATAASGYQAVPVRAKATLDSLRTDPNWVAASKQSYNFRTGKTWQGTDAEAADEGMDDLRWSKGNLGMFAEDGRKLLSRGTPEDHNAFLYMMDQWDAAGTSAGSFAKSVGIGLTDPINLISIPTLGMATVGKVAVSLAARQALKAALVQSVTQAGLKSLGRTGIQAGVIGGVQAGVTNSIKQGIEVSGGRKESADYRELAGDAAIGAVAGVVIGTTADALLTQAAPMVKNVMGKISGIFGHGVKKEAAVVADTVAADVVKVAEGAAAPALAKAEAGAVVDGVVAREAGHIPEAVATKEGALVPEPVPTPHESPTAPPAASDTAPLPSALTREEIEAITTREQKGRKAIDDVVPDGPLDARAIVKLEIPELVHGGRDTATNQVDLIAKGRSVADQLNILTTKELADTFEIARNGQWSLGQIKVWSMAGQVVHQAIRREEVEINRLIKASPDSPLMAEWLAKLADLDTRKIPSMLFDEMHGSFAGSLNRQRQSLLMELKGSSIDSIMREQGATRAEATMIYQDLVISADKSMEAMTIAAKYDLKIEEALNAGQHVEVFKLQTAKTADLAKVAENMAEGGGSFFMHMKERGSQILHSIAGGTKEVMISAVFGPGTALINITMPLLKTLTLPFIRYLVTNPLEKARFVEMTSHYAALASTNRAAWAKSMAAFKYEQSILTRDSGRLMEGELVLPGKIGGGIRLIPRILNASDEYLSQINYAAFVDSHAMMTAHLEGTEKGLTGKALGTFRTDARDAARATMYESADAELLRPVVNKGINLGYEGEKLTAYVTQQAESNGVLESLRHGSDKQALDAVREVLYKKRFSGEGFASNAAQTIETVMTRHPALSVLTGQFFFRTLVRIFEEGIRMTPGINFLPHSFMNDLLGVNGVQRQIRAQGESMAGLAVTGTLLVLYAQGRLTGDLAYANYRQEKVRQDGTGAPQYSITSKDGDSWSFKNMEPLATPIKIIVNALERYDSLKIKESQDFFVNKPAHEKVIAQITVGLGAITTAISDANLVAGAKGMQDLIKSFMDPEAQEDATLKKVGTMLAMLVPNTLHKLAKTNDPFIRDPATFAQIIQSRLGHDLFAVGEVTSPYAYDVLGEKRTPADMGAIWSFLSVSTKEERVRGHSADHQIVMNVMDQLASEVGATFNAPKPTRPETGGLDLRTVMTADGKETLFDRWQNNYREMNPARILSGIAQSGLPHGTFEDNSQKQMKTSALQDQIKELQDFAFAKLMKEDKVVERLKIETIKHTRAGGGLLDTGNRNK